MKKVVLEFLDKQLWVSIILLKIFDILMLPYSITLLILKLNEISFISLQSILATFLIFIIFIPLIFGLVAFRQTVINEYNDGGEENAEWRTKKISWK